MLLNYAEKIIRDINLHDYERGQYLNKMSGIELITKERVEQLEKHGWDTTHDDEHKEYQLADVALYALTEDEDYWPEDWDDSYIIKIAAKEPKERLIVAGALIAAEIDRLERLENTETKH